MEQLPASNPLSQASALLQDREIPPEERASILKQIEKVVEEGRQHITCDAFLVKPRKRGVLLATSGTVASGHWPFRCKIVVRNTNTSSSTARLP
jgi:hypothetical protein